MKDKFANRVVCVLDCGHAVHHDCLQKKILFQMDLGRMDMYSDRVHSAKNQARMKS